MSFVVLESPLRMQSTMLQWVDVVQTRSCSADIRFSSFAVRATLWCPAGSTAFGEHVQAHRCHIAPVPWRTEQAGLPGSLQLTVLIFSTSLQVAFTEQTCRSLCILPAHV